MKAPPFALLLTLALAAPTPAPLLAQAQQGPSLIVLVRHAERAGPSADDPGLTPIGAERALDLTRLLEDAGITRIHSSDTRRTQETALPLARDQGLEIEIYNHRDVEGFAARLLTMPGRHLVVGHSNTTDEMSVFLGGASHGPIVEAWEYDRLYFLTPRPEGGMETVLVRFGPVPEHP
jgi:2,3-bisphosphoglycerate-dependent phosphoglycerate mutase